MLARVGVLEHLRSPQFMTEDGRPTRLVRESRFAWMWWVLAPGTPRWVGYLTCLVIVGVASVLLVASDDVITGLYVPLILIGAAIYGLVEVWRGKPIWSRDRIDYPPPDNESQPSKPR